jgi:hypothetical protein
LLSVTFAPNQLSLHVTGHQFSVFTHPAGPPILMGLIRHMADSAIRWHIQLS